MRPRAAASSTKLQKGKSGQSHAKVLTAGIYPTCKSRKLTWQKTASFIELVAPTRSMSAPVLKRVAQEAPKLLTRSLRTGKPVLDAGHGGHGGHGYVRQPWRSAMPALGLVVAVLQ